MLQGLEDVMDVDEERPSLVGISARSKPWLKDRVIELELEIEILREENRRLKLALQEAFRAKD